MRLLLLLVAMKWPLEVVATGVRGESGATQLGVLLLLLLFGGGLNR